MQRWEAPRCCGARTTGKHSYAITRHMRHFGSYTELDGWQSMQGEQGNTDVFTHVLHMSPPRR